MVRRKLPHVVFVFLFACGSFKDDVTAMCTIPPDVEESITSNHADAVQRPRIEIEHDEKVVRSSEGKALIVWLKDEVNHLDRAPRMEEAAKKAGVTHCSFVDDLRAADQYKASPSHP